MENLKILDKEFEILIPHSEIQERVKSIANQINQEFENQEVIFLSVLNGAFMFASDLLKEIKVKSKISFVKLASYQGTTSEGKVKNIIGINEDIKDAIVIVIEDIIDTGLTMEHVIKQLQEYQPKEIKLATLVFKPDTFKAHYDIDYIGMDIPNNFIVGYGLDYNGYGRNYKDIYTLVEEK